MQGHPNVSVKTSAASSSTDREKYKVHLEKHRLNIIKLDLQDMKLTWQEAKELAADKSKQAGLRQQ